MAGPLSGIRVIELAGIGPGPFAGMMLADMGAEVISVERPGGNPVATFGHSVLLRNRKSLALNLKHPQAAEVVLRLCEKSDALFEGNRPGVAERLGVGPDACFKRNPKLVYGRMTGWGQSGPMAQAAGHDINYIALAGALGAIGPRGQKPSVPLNVIGDFGGGGLMLAYGMVCAMLEARKTGKGQVVDAAMIDGASALMAMWWSLKNQKLASPERGSNMLDSGAHFYDVYETRDGKYLSIGAIEPQFYALLKQKMQLGPEFNAQMSQKDWPALKEKLSAVVKTKTRDEWMAIFDGSDACVAPVLSLDEAPVHPHHAAREGFVRVGTETQPAPAPRFSHSAPGLPQPAPAIGRDTRALLAEAGYAAAEIEALEKSGAAASV